MPSSREIGNEAEEFAAQYLKSIGYVIITRNYTIRGGEVDLIALEEECLIFIEVRMRKDGTATETISERKKASLIKTATHYRTEHQDEREFRFDLLTYNGNSIEHFKDFVYFD